MTVDLFQYSRTAAEAARVPRRRRERVSCPKQKALNEKRAKKYFAQLCNTNFTAADYHVTLTYARDNLPPTMEDAKRMVKNYLRRVERRRQKLGLPAAKYIVVHEGVPAAGGGLKRLHQHIIISGGLPREEMEMLWSKQRISWARAGDTDYKARLKRIGFANCDALQPAENGLEQLARYLTKDPAGKKRWSCSQNLEKPVRATNDSKYSVRKLENIARSGDIWARDWWEEHYPGYTLAGSAEAAVDAEPPGEWNNWIIYARLRRVQESPPRAGGKKAAGRGGGA